MFTASAVSGKIWTVILVRFRENITSLFFVGMQLMTVEEKAQLEEFRSLITPISRPESEYVLLVYYTFCT